MDQLANATWIEAVCRQLHEFDYEYGLAVRWRVAGPGTAVLLDPRISFGAPIVSGIATWAIKGRWSAGETIAEIANDFGLVGADVRAALDFESVELAA